MSARRRCARRGGDRRQDHGRRSRRHGQGGIRGIRLNLTTGGSNDPGLARQRFQAGSRAMTRRSWYIQIYTNLG